MFHFLWRIRPYYRQVAGELVIGSLAGILMNTAVVLPAILLGRAIDTALAFSRREVDASAVAWASLLFVAGTLATELPRVFKRWFLITANGRMRANLRADLLRGVLAWPMARVHQTHIGDLMARIVGDVEVWGVGMRRLVIETWDTLLFTLSYVVAMLWYDAGLTLVVLAPTLVAVPILSISGRWVRGRTTRARQANAAYTASLQEQLSGVRVLRLFDRVEAAVEQVSQLSRKQADANIESEWLRVSIQPIYTLIITAGAILLVWQGGERVLAGLMTVGSFVAYLELYLRVIVRGFREIAILVNQVQASQAAYARLQDMSAPARSMRGEPLLASFRPSHIVGLRADGTAPFSPPSAVSVSLQHVTFRYPGEGEHAGPHARLGSRVSAPALDDISLEVPAGALVAVTGPVGAGKSALARALLGVYPLESGRILFDGKASFDTLPIGYLPQEPFLFSGSIRENILFGANLAGFPDASTLSGKDKSPSKNASGWHGRPVNERALSVAALRDDLQSFPAGLETQIGELGVRVSGGQRQRIALARALAAFAPHAPGLLVLDDPFSAVDVNTEAQIVSALRESFGPAAPVAQRATIMLCSHRLAAFPQADLIVVLDCGRIREQGTHPQLMAAGGLYARIFTAQQKVEQPA